MKKSVIKKNLTVFDFDYTLYNPEKWKILTYNNLAKTLHEDPEKFRKLAQDAYAGTRRIGYFEPRLFLQEILKNRPYKAKLDELLEIIYNPLTFSDCFYSETIEVLSRLSEYTDYGIFSTNDSTFFQAKFSRIKRFFREDMVIVSPDKYDLISTISELTNDFKVIMVDDLIGILDSAKKTNEAITTVWIKRGPYAEKETLPTDFTPDWKIKNLEGLSQVITEN